MSTKFGARPPGSDGSDFRHRQRVAAHYKDSVVNKFRLRIVLCLHLLMLFLIFFKVLEDLLDQFSLDWGPLERMNVPTPHLWEYWWLLSAVPAFLGFTAMPRNNEPMMRRAYYGVFLFALLPIAYGAGHSLPIFIDYVRNPKQAAARGNVEVFLDFPMIVLEYAFFIVSFQIHAFTMYFMSQLVKAWQPIVVTTTGVNHSANVGQDGGDGVIADGKKFK